MTEMRFHFLVTHGTDTMAWALPYLTYALKGDTNPRIPDETRRIVFRCLEKQPRARFPSMKALGAELGGLASVS